MNDAEAARREDRSAAKRYKYSVVSRVPPEVEAFRVAFRAKEVGPRYSGWLHFAFTSSVALGVVVFAATRVEAPRPVEWLTIPLSFVISNFAEYFGHKGPMHRPRRGLGILFERHTQQHHHFFTHDAMAYESARDFKMVLFPPVMILFFLGGIATPIAIGLHVLAGPNAAWLFVATGVGYFVLYEWLHFAYHLEPSTWLGRRALVRLLRRHHTLHHDKALMGRWNFNITFPIGDVLFGTMRRAPRDA